MLILSVVRCADKFLDIPNADRKVTWVYEDLYLPGTKVEYTCRDNLTMVPESFSGVVCGDSGFWDKAPDGSDEDPSCVKGALVFIIYIYIQQTKFLKKGN